MKFGANLTLSHAAADMKFSLNPSELHYNCVAAQGLRPGKQGVNNVFLAGCEKKHEWTSVREGKWERKKGLSEENPIYP